MNASKPVLIATTIVSVTNTLSAPARSAQCEAHGSMSACALEAPEPADKHQHEPESALQERGVAAAVGSASTHVPPSRQLFDQLAQQYDRQATNQIVQINAEMRRRQIAPLLPGSPRI